MKKKHPKLDFVCPEINLELRKNLNLEKTLWTKKSLIRYGFEIRK